MGYTGVPAGMVVCPTCPRLCFWSDTFWCSACEVRVCGVCWAADHPVLFRARGWEPLMSEGSWRGALFDVEVA